MATTLANSPANLIVCRKAIPINYREDLRGLACSSKSSARSSPAIEDKSIAVGQPLSFLFAKVKKKERSFKKEVLSLSRRLNWDGECAPKVLSGLVSETVPRVHRSPLKKVHNVIYDINVGWLKALAFAM
jgi:hypothetical protein